MVFPAGFPAGAIGTYTPLTVGDVQNAVIPVLRNCILLKDQIKRAKDWLDHEDMTQPPVSMSPDYQAEINAAVSDLNTALQAVDLSRVVKVTGLF